MVMKIPKFSLDFSLGWSQNECSIIRKGWIKITATIVTGK